MTSINLIFRVHLPQVLNKQLGTGILQLPWFNAARTKDLLNYVSDYCYLPANLLLQKKLKTHKGKFSVSFSISGILIELLNKYRPDVVASFRQLVRTGNVEMLGETYYNSHSSLYSEKEFIRQTGKHARIIMQVFQYRPSVFRNTDLIYCNDVAKLIRQAGFKRVIADFPSGNYLPLNTRSYGIAPSGVEILFRDGGISDQIAFGDPRLFSYHEVNEKITGAAVHSGGTVNVMLDYETFGVYRNSSTGIFNLLDELPSNLLENENIIFSTPSTSKTSKHAGVFDCPDITTWNENHPGRSVDGQNILRRLYKLEKTVKAEKDPELLETWSALQDTDMLKTIAVENIFPVTTINQLPNVMESYSNAVSSFESHVYKTVLDQIRKNNFQRMSFNIY